MHNLAIKEKRNMSAGDVRKQKTQDTKNNEFLIPENETPT